MPTRQIHCLGLNHRTAPVELRELFASPLVEPEHVLFPSEQTGDERSGDIAADRSATGECPYHSKGRTSGDLIRERREKEGQPARKRREVNRRPGNGRFARVLEATVFATCNRMELYACVDPSAEDPIRLLTEFLGVIYDVEPAKMNSRMYHYTGLEAAAHLCQVAAGLDSQVLGETQIMGQVTGAYENALDTIAAGPIIHTIFRAAIRAGKRARTETTFSSNPASMSSVAIATAQDILGDLRDNDILVVGMGEMGMLTLRALHARQLDRVGVVSRSPDRARAISDHWGFRTYSLGELPEAMAEADVVITSTAAQDTVIRTDTVREAMKGRENRVLVVVDIAVPRDVEPEVGKLTGVHLVDADDLKVTLDKSLEARKREIPKVEEIIAQEAVRCDLELQELALRPVITDLREKAELIRKGELERTLRHLPDVDSKTIDHIHHMSRAIVNKLLHEPTVRLKRSAKLGHHDELTSTVRHLFDLPDNNES
jgi:glutamyl-tRNA reductase